jgi:hypothetical protein
MNKNQRAKLNIKRRWLFNALIYFYFCLYTIWRYDDSFKFSINESHLCVKLNKYYIHLQNGKSFLIRFFFS